MDAMKERTLSLDAKLIAATNMAVAEAIWQTYYLQRGGQPTVTADKTVLSDVKQAAKKLDELVKQIEADAEANTDELRPTF